MVYLQTVEDELKFAVEEYQLWIHTNEERRWRNFVGSLEKSFTDLYELTKGTPLAKYVKRSYKLKQTDPLLNYIRVSRNAVHHSSDRITAYEATGVPGPHSVISGMNVTSVDKNGIKTVHDAAPNGWVELILILPTLEERKNVNGKLQSRKFTPPRTHLGRALKNPKSPEEVADLAFQFYYNLVEDIKRRNA